MSIINTNMSFRNGNFLLKVKCTLGNGITGVYGASGSGKTTFLHLLAGLQTPHKGHIQVNGKMLVNTELNINTPSFERNIGYVFQNSRLFPHLTVKQNLLYSSNSKLRSNFDEIVGLLGLEPYLNKKPGLLSGGQKQRVAIGRAFLHNPDLLLLDEPFSSLDFKIKNQIIHYIARICNKYNIPTIIVSHDLSDILKLTKDILIFDKGRIADKGKFFEVLQQKDNVPYFFQSELLNVFELEVEEYLLQGKLVKCVINNSRQNVYISNNSGINTIEKGQRAKICLRPEDIAISLRQVKDISIRNQVQATVVKIIHKDNHSFCLLDAGINLIAEITDRSQSELEIKEGANVWCLFKAIAPEIIF